MEVDIMKTCYVICPLGEEGSDIRKRSDKLLDIIINPVIELTDYELIRADLSKDQWSGTIHDSISAHIFRDDLVIADLTDSNPNVFYELGKRHAWGGRTIHLSTNPEKLPFDVHHYPVLKYDLSNSDKIEKLRSELRQAIDSLNSITPQCPYPLTPDDVIRLSNATVVVNRILGRRDHYYLAENLAQKKCKRMFLMQRSSSLILGPEQGWGAEEVFYNTIMKKIEENVEFFHVVSLEGISRHLDRPQSTFPKIKQALGNLVDAQGLVAIQNNKTWHIKKIVEKNPDTKPDRQARIFVIENIDGDMEGVVVFDLGDTQCCLHIKGKEMHDFMHDCLDFYAGCEYLKWDEVLKVSNDHNIDIHDLNIKKVT